MSTTSHPGFPAGCAPERIPSRRKAAPQRHVADTRRSAQVIPSGTYAIAGPDGWLLVRLDRNEDLDNYTGWVLDAAKRPLHRIPGRQLAEVVGRVRRLGVRAARGNAALYPHCADPASPTWTR